MSTFNYSPDFEASNPLIDLLIHDEDARAAVARIGEQTEYLQKKLAAFDGSESERMQLEQVLSDHFNPPLDINNLSQYWTHMAAGSNPDETPFAGVLSNLQGFYNAAQDSIKSAGGRVLPDMDGIAKANLRIEELVEAANQLDNARQEFDRALSELQSEERPEQ